VAAAALGRAAFTRADADKDGKMTLDEFQASLDTPLKRAFQAADANDDGKLTDDEAASMMWWLSEDRSDAASKRGYGLLSSLVEVSAVGK
jgi:Ca2+-binding EF-hand superfamily protein